MEEKIQEIETNISEEKEEKKMSKKSKFLIAAGVIGGIATVAGLVVSKIAKKNNYIPVEYQDDDDEFIDEEDLDSEVEENSDSNKTE